MSTRAPLANRLARETSPYLLQHAHNPVDWYPWGEEAFAKARAEDKPILLSVGYATCHWCHVMERESFEDESIAAILNTHFVPIKVDREELPDVDHVYMSALQAMTGQGGWPMNLFLTPQRVPFYGGTYFPPVARYGRASFADVLAGVHAAWSEGRDDIERSAADILAHLQRPPPHAAGAPVGDVHRHASARLARSFDASRGGFGGAPKFPQAPLLQYLLTLAAIGDGQARTMLGKTLTAMAEGGMYDQVGGGFARYSTDAHWHVPHFEKMLYDNAQLLRVYAGAHRLTGDARLRFIAEDTAAWLLREMRPAAGGAAFASAQDADSEGEEGRFYVWTLAQLRDVLGADADAAALLYGATEEGNWEHGVNVLQRRDAAAVIRLLGLSPEAFDAWEQGVRGRLYAARKARIAPITDDKVLADWNGMALRALAEAGRLLARPDYVHAAHAIAHFLRDTMRAGGYLRHAWRNGVLREESYLADHAQVGLGLLELHAATGEAEWLAEAHALCEQMMARFHDAGAGFFDAEAGALPVRARDIHDGATPSPTAAACELLLRLASAFGRDDWLDAAYRTFERHAALLDVPPAVPALAHAHLLGERGAEVALIAPADAFTETRGAFAPLATFVYADAQADLPLARGRQPGLAYLCRRGACQLPARSGAELRTQLDALQFGAPGDAGDGGG